MKRKKNYVDFSFAMALAVQSAITIVFALFVGWFIDSWLGTSPFFMAGLAFFGFIASLYGVYKRMMSL